MTARQYLALAFRLTQSRWTHRHTRLHDCGNCFSAHGRIYSIGYQCPDHWPTFPTGDSHRPAPAEESTVGSA